jgi:hypothetical protein
MSLPEVVTNKNQERLKSLRNLNSRIRRVHKILLKEQNFEAEGYNLERIRQVSRCQNCPGCLNWKKKTCDLCEGCLSRKGCTEVSRNCYAWPLAQIPGRNRSASSLGSSELQDLRVETMHLQSAQTELENITAVQISLVQEADPPIVEHHVMAEKKISEETDQMSSRAEDMILMAETHLFNVNKLAEFDDEDLEPGSQEERDELNEGSVEDTEDYERTVENPPLRVRFHQEKIR